jgi:hypothetical protein
MLAYLTERILQFSILKQLTNSTTLCVGGVRVSNLHEPLRYHYERRGLDKEDEANRHDYFRSFVSGSERARPRLSTSGGHPSMRLPSSLN